jgi:pyrroloquinoline quinone biosynthesis protein B
VRARVLGSAAGGGFPQWNCGCANCRAAREPVANDRPRRAYPRTQESVALSADSESWFLLNASPEVRAQIESFAPLHPRGPRHSPIAGVVLTNGDLDHCLGLLSLREWQPLRVYATAAVRDGFTQGNVLQRTLQRFDGQLRWVELALGKPTPLLRADGSPSGLAIEPIAVPGKLPIHVEGLREPSDEDNVGLLVRHDAQGPHDSSKLLAYLPALSGPTPAVVAALSAAHCSFVDGTFWWDDELIRLGLGDKRAAQMAHWPVGGEDGSLARLRTMPGRRILIHVNNTNPLLLEDSEQRVALNAAGVELAYDGMELEV